MTAVGEALAANALDSRELATLTILGLIAFLALRKPATRRTLKRELKNLAIQLASPKLWIPFAIYFLWVFGCIYFASRIGLWGWALTKDTILVVFGVGLVLFAKATEQKNGRELFKSVYREAIGVSALLVFYLNLAPLPYLAELPLQVVIIVLVFADAQDDGRKWPRGMLVLAGLGLLAWTSFQVVESWATLNHVELLMRFALSIWLPLALFPLLYPFAFFAAMESAAVRTSFGGEPWTRRSRLAFFLGLRGSLHLAASFNGRYRAIRDAKTFREGRAYMKYFRSDVEERETLRERQRHTLDVWTNKGGTDKWGAQLDRREFDGTKRALRFIQASQMGWFERQANQFWGPEKAELIIQPTARFELPPNHGIHVEVTDDRKVWRAWRRLPSGWILGIGGQHRTDTQYYSASASPNTWPGADDWISELELDLPPDWAQDDSVYPA
ncbi:hypothetical protein [Leucobacter massiliensis]|uniref:hypothetical protein n=1 Tax=Leucobacter massiliensis TaxID=1686285 RepID=UPI0011B1FA4B|nr:hypothetical protein [Leucobacter massiliensis]